MAGIGSQSPNWREALTAKDSISGNSVYVTSTNGRLDTNASVSISGSSIPISGATTAIVTAIVDSSGNQISTFGGGTQYIDGGSVPVHPTAPTLVYDNSGTWVHVSASAGLPVAIVSGGGSGGTSSSFSASFPSTGTAIGATDGTNMQPLKVDGSDNLLVKVNTALPAGTNVIGHAVIDTGSTTAVTQATAANLNATIVGTGTLAVQAAQSGTWNITNVSGTISLPTGASTAAKQPALGTAGTPSADVLTVQGVTSMTALKVDGSGVTQPVSGTFWQATQPVSLATNTPTLQSGSTTAVTQATAASLNATVVGTGTFAAQVAGGTASGSSLTANPVTEGGLAKTANPTAVADGQVVNALFDKLGKQIVVGSVRDLKVNQVTTITASASETTVLTAVASTFLDVYGCIVTNTSATAVTVAFKDSTAGTTQYNIAVPAGDTRGFMLPEGGAIKQGTVNNNWTATTQSVSSVVITVLAVKNI